MNELSSNQRKILSRMAQTVKPVVQIGQNGLTDAVIKKIDQSLACHELIKIKFISFKDEKEILSQKLCEACSASLVRIIGNTAIVYRPSDDPPSGQEG
ncbi:YhbY family RNA-binding protein [Treponema parvum]|uniref:YhbY family RNA-binding protein n=1 Tax=Treponema parvum TaxID=138851 RepID=UPI001AEC51AA|nr:YhbY family RNA-binding protein [Treponema parvum]QTQ17277.1 YhbY family RNA-binding protein [Treponema parvum]